MLAPACPGPAREGCLACKPAAFAYDPPWQGLLIDGSAEQSADAGIILPQHIRIQHCFLSLNNIE